LNKNKYFKKSFLKIVKKSFQAEESVYTLYFTYIIITGNMFMQYWKLKDKQTPKQARCSLLLLSIQLRGEKQK
jgi:low temperature requirement protein LtrA